MPHYSEAERVLPAALYSAPLESLLLHLLLLTDSSLGSHRQIIILFII